MFAPIRQRRWGAVLIASLALWAIVEVPCRVAILRGWDRWVTNIRRPTVSGERHMPRAE